MAGRRRGASRGAARGSAPRIGTRRSARHTQPQARDETVPNIYHEMLAEAGVTSSRMTSDVPDRPLKRPRTGRRPEEIRAEEARLAQAAKLQETIAPTQNTEQPESEAKESSHVTERPLKRPGTGRRPEDIRAEEAKLAQAAKLQETTAHTQNAEQPESEAEEDIEFEDVEIPKPTVQTSYLSSDDDSDEDEEIEFEDVDIEAAATKQENEGSKEPSKETAALQLNLTAAKQALTPSKRKKQPLTKEDKERRVVIHQVHLLLLLADVEKRNHWCNDPVAQSTLRSVLPAKIAKFLTPASNLTQFGQTESLKRGLSEAGELFRERFKITEYGLRRPLWAENLEDLENMKDPKNMDSCHDKEGFRRAARTLKGSRDVGALLFCALLRAVGVEARVVCSLQALSFVPGGPSPKIRKVTPARARPAPVMSALPAQQTLPSTFPSAIRSRLGHPNAAAYHMPDIASPQVVEWESPQQRRAQVHIAESDYPVFWTEILDVGHQKWQPVDVLVTGTHFKAHKLEPPASDRENRMTYVVAMEDDGAAKDVTRRYAKAYTAKTRRLRIDGPMVPHAIRGAKWWRKALKRYRPRELSDLDQIEDTELKATEAREPMPRNVSDFKDHPIYALERHLRRHEVLIPGAKVVGTVGAGSKGPLEKIYRRNEVRLTKSADKWYRSGREIIPGEEPLKVLPKRKTAKRKGRFRHLNNSPQSSDDDDPILGPDPAKGVPLFAYEQTQLYIPPQVVAGRIPKNRFKNIDAYVPSMIPAGGFHFKHPRAGHAAHILGVDYAPALQGFQFKGRQGTAVYNGVVIPVEAVEAVRAVINGFRDMELQLEEDRRSRRALETWRNWLRTLTIRRRLFQGDDYWGDTVLGEFEIPPESSSSEEEAESEQEQEEAETEEEHDVNPRGSRRRRRPRNGVVLDDDDDDGGGGFEPGGFVPEPGGFEPGDYGPGGFEPGGFEPGGFEPGGFEPGGFEPGGFEPGGLGPEAGDFEVEANFKGKGRAPERPIFSQTPRDTSSPQPANSGGANDRSMTHESGGFETEADIEMPDAPAVGTMIGALQETESGLQPSNNAGARFDTTNTAIDQEPFESLVEAEQQGTNDAAVGAGSTKALSQVNSEDALLEDVPSDHTEEFYMDDDGTLVED